jgi:60S ribosome subunit biogenesis protein NIP7
MRPLTKEETVVFFEKLAKYIGRNIQLLIDRKDEVHCFRVHAQKVYYLPEKLMKQATSINKKDLISLGVCFGKFTKTLKFRLLITSLDFLAQFAKYKVWVKPSGEMSFMYGNHVLKAHLGRITEDTPEHQGVIVYTMSDIPIGFGVTSKTTNDYKRMEPTAICVYHQSDIGEYLRDEDTLF